MRFAPVMAADPTTTDKALAALAARLTANGACVRGALQGPPVTGDLGREMWLRVLPDGPDALISQRLGPSAKGCRLDPPAFEAAIHGVVQALDAGTDAVILSKFGEQESLGRGYVPLITAALEHGIPVLIGLRPSWRAAFATFQGETVAPLPANVDVLEAWIRS